ncbi:MAG: DUF5689 domain-containing protein [Bacteroidales bacterium]|jgi:hypothetical protein|nr:DUF5689 domain-containing protein [Bacteroidales bacterium]
MKINILISIIVSVLSILFIGCERELDSPPLGKVDESKILKIEDVYKIYADSGNNYMFKDDYMLYVTVIMDDASGNIYREAYVQDETGGINLYRLGAAGVTELNSYVRINLKNVTITDYSGKLELVFDNVENPKRQIVILKSNVPVTPAEVSLSEIFAGTYDCVLVNIKDVEFADTTQTYATFGGSSYQNRTIQNCEGRSIIVRSSDQADFAGYPVAKGKGNIVGVITKHVRNGTTWQLLIRNVDDVNMEEDRCTSGK